MTAIDVDGCRTLVGMNEWADNIMQGLGIIRLEHVGIAVADASDHPLLELLGRPVYKTESVSSEHVDTHFIRVGDSKIELLEATDDASVIKGYVDKYGPGIHHLAFEVSDIYTAHERATKMGLRVLNETPKRGADNKMIFFLHPKSTGGVLVELCQTVTDESS